MSVALFQTVNTDYLVAKANSERIKEDLNSVFCMLYIVFSCRYCILTVHNTTLNTLCIYKDNKGPIRIRKSFQLHYSCRHMHSYRMVHVLFKTIKNNYIVDF